MTRPVIVALDLDNEEKLHEILSKLGKPENVFIKVGMELFYNAGIDVVKKVADQGSQTFLGLKGHAVPNPD